MVEIDPGSVAVIDFRNFSYYDTIGIYLYFHRKHNSVLKALPLYFIFVIIHWPRNVYKMYVKCNNFDRYLRNLTET